MDIKARITNFKDHAVARMKHLQPKTLLYYGLILAIIVSLGIAALNIIDLNSHYSDKAQNAVADGKRIIIDVEAVTIEQRASEEEAPEEALPEVLDEPPAETQALDDEAPVEEEPVEELPEEEVYVEEPLVQMTLPEAEDDKFTDATRPKLAIIIKNLGRDAALTKRALTLPEQTTLAFLPYGEDAMENWRRQMDETGHSFLIQLPFETLRFPFEDYGRLMILANGNNIDNLLHLKKVLEFTNGYSGVIAPPNDKLTHNIPTITPMLEMIRKYGTTFIYNQEITNQKLEYEIQKTLLPYISNYRTIRAIESDILLQETLDDITAELEDGVTRELIIAVDANPMIISQLKPWLFHLRHIGVEIIPAHHLAKEGYPEAPKPAAAEGNV